MLRFPETPPCFADSNFIQQRVKVAWLLKNKQSFESTRLKFSWIHDQTRLSSSASFTASVIVSRQLSWLENKTAQALPHIFIIWKQCFCIILLIACSPILFAPMVHWSYKRRFPVQALLTEETYALSVTRVPVIGSSIFCLKNLLRQRNQYVGPFWINWPIPAQGQGCWFRGNLCLFYYWLFRFQKPRTSAKSYLGGF